MTIVDFQSTSPIGQSSRLSSKSSLSESLSSGFVPISSSSASLIPSPSESLNSSNRLFVPGERVANRMIIVVKTTRLLPVIIFALRVNQDFCSDCL